MSNRNDITLKALALNDELKNHPLIAEVKNKEKLMLEDEAVILKIMSFQKAQDDINNPYNHSREFQESLEKRLDEAKHALYSEPKVNDYFMAHKNARLFLKNLAGDLLDNLVLEIDSNADPFTRMAKIKSHKMHK
jgi:cell fate (sporulation/competence/biofilm development) regulator YlbF (YheA/YmcA/DUF963 family)